MKQRVLL